MSLEYFQLHHYIKLNLSTILEIIWKHKQTGPVMKLKENMALNPSRNVRNLCLIVLSVRVINVLKYMFILHLNHVVMS